MNRKAFLYQKSEDGKCALYLDEENAETLFEFLNADPKRAKKFADRIRYILAGQTTRDIYAQENIETGCEHVYAIKMFKGGQQNARIYCQQYYEDDLEVLVIILAELLPKKKNQKLSYKEKSIIRRVAGYTYQLTSNEQENS